MKKINIKIDGKRISCKEGESILKIAKENNIYIPALCNHPDFKVKGNCGVCLVELKGKDKLKRACKTPACSGMEIYTDSPKVKKHRNLNIELLFAEHIEKCNSCVSKFNCDLLDMARKYDIEISRFKERKANRKTYKFANAVEIDGSQCIDCRNCVDACSIMQNINYLKIKGSGINQEIVPVTDKDIDCIYCGQCVVHCPVAAAQEQGQWMEVERVLENKNKIVVAQFAPSIRVSIGEEFGMNYGKITTDKVVAGLRELGFNHIFDVNFGADITTMVEAEELIERIKKKKVMPMITSCCPAWVKYVEFYHPELIPNLTTARSPHIHSAGVIKTYWAKKMKVNPFDIVVVSIMPCTAKKFEASRPELRIHGMNPVDYVLTTREFAFLMKKNNVDFANIKGAKPDSILNNHSGAGAIYGGSGGVMESALRTAYAKLCKNKDAKICEERIDFKDVRGLSGVKESVVKIGKKKIRVAVVNGIGNVEGVIENLKDYDYIEVMACPGGCIGGGGQPIPTTDEIRKKRIAALYKIDRGKKIRKAHENKEVIEILKELKKRKLDHKVLHTRYIKRRRN